MGICNIVMPRFRGNTSGIAWRALGMGQWREGEKCVLYSNDRQFLGVSRNHTMQASYLRAKACDESHYTGHGRRYRSLLVRRQQLFYFIPRWRSLAPDYNRDFCLVVLLAMT